MVCLALCGALFGAKPLSAQTFYGSLTGVVTDSSGAVVPGASVTVVETSTSVEYKTVTDRQGSYRVSFLKPGEYVVRVQKNGFEEFETAAIALVMNQDALVDAKLKVGSDSQVVTVTTGGSELNDTNSEIGTEMGPSDLINLPVSIGTHGSEELLLSAQVPGVSSTSPDYSNPNNISLGGGRPDTNPIIVDGLPSNMGVNDTYGFVPSPDSTEELQVLTAPFSAQYGQSGGGAILTTTRSGTNKFHGSLFEDHSDQSMDALSYFSAPDAIKPVNVFNYFGGSIGGPVWIPKFFDGRKHHLFFFTDWEDTLSASSKTLTTNVPTLRERTGDFAGPTPQGAPTPVIYDPRTLHLVGNQLQGTPFPGNQIPVGRPDTVGMNFVSFYPTPNCTYETYNYCVYPTGYSSYLYNTDRIDFNATDRDHIWAKFSRDGPRSSAVNYVPNAANTSAYGGWTDDHWETSWSHIFNPQISNEARFGYVSEVNFSYPLTPAASSLGLTGVPLTQFPSLAVTGLYSLGTGSYSWNLDGHYVLNDAVVMQMGRHTLSLGGEYMDYVYSQYDPGVLSGSYAFNGQFTSTSGQSVLGLADLELGLPDSTTISTNNTWFRESAKYGSLYIQDDYRVTQNLTLNLGLRWEFDGPYTEVNDQMYTFNPSLIDPSTQKMGAIQFAGYQGAPRTFAGRDYMGFLPRVGFNYHALKNTVIRAGYGLYELPGIGFGATALTSKSTVNTTFNTTATSPAYQLQNGVPAYYPQVGANGEPLITTSLTNPTQNVVELQQNGVLPYIQQWQLGVQQDLGRGWIAEVDYQGNHGVHLPISLPVNQIQPTTGCCYGLSQSADQSLRPYPQVLTVTYDENGGASDYNALQAKLTHAWSHGISMIAAYTYAKQMDDVDPSARGDAVAVQNVYNLHAQWGTAMTDVPQRLSITSVYALPIGAGGRLLARTPVVNQVIGHWRVSTVASFQMGYPYNVTQSNTTGLYNGAQYMTEVGNPSIARSQRTVTNWFNTKAFTTTPVDMLGNAPRASLFGPGQNVWNVSLMRDVPLGEHATFTFRADAYNLFNHPQFDGLGTSSTSATFGHLTAAEDQRQVLIDGRIRF